MLKIINFNTFYPYLRERFYLSTKITFFLYGSAKILYFHIEFAAIFGQILLRVNQVQVDKGGNRVYKPFRLDAPPFLMTRPRQRKKEI
jgi:hypothetical protein